jgi:hypothetical protein
MKAQIDLRSTLNNSTPLQRGGAALAALGLLALIGVLFIYSVGTSVPATPEAGTAPAQHTASTPNFGTGSVYDGGHYVDWQPAKRIAPKVPDFGTGSVYDGGHYVDWQPAKPVAPKVPDFGTGSVYDGGHYVDWQPVTDNSANR